MSLKPLEAGATANTPSRPPITKLKSAKPKQPKLRDVARTSAHNRRSRENPALVFSALAWLKLQYLCHKGQTEIGAFAITRKDQPLYVEDISTVKQACTAVTVEFDDAAVADFFDDQVDAGRSPEQFARIWVHTHPGDCPNPSGTDEETFDRVFGRCHWAVMFILARGGSTYCRLRVQSGVALKSSIPVKVDYDDFHKAIASASPQLWDEEYQRNVKEQPSLSSYWWRDEDPEALANALDDLEFSDEAMQILRELDEEPWMDMLEEFDEEQLKEVADAE